MMKVMPLCLALALLAAGPGVSHGDDLPPRPALEDYADQEAFVKDVLAWQRLKRRHQSYAAVEQRAEQQQPGEHDWHHVTGPEELDDALRKAYGYTQPNYQEKYRFNRTTHLSFPLEKMESNQLSSQAITGTLQPAEGESPSLEPLPELESILQETHDEDVNSSRYSLDHGQHRALKERLDTVQVMAN